VWFINYAEGREECHPQSPKARVLPLIGVLPSLAGGGMICCTVWFINCAQGREGCHPQRPKARVLPLIGVFPSLVEEGRDMIGTVMADAEKGMPYQLRTAVSNQAAWVHSIL